MCANSSCHCTGTFSKGIPEGDGEEAPDGEGELPLLAGLGEDPEPAGDGEGDVEGGAKRLPRIPLPALFRTS